MRQLDNTKGYRIAWQVILSGWTSLKWSTQQPYFPSPSPLCDTGTKQSSSSELDGKLPPKTLEVPQAISMSLAHVWAEGLSRRCKRAAVLNHGLEEQAKPHRRTRKQWQALWKETVILASKKHFKNIRSLSVSWKWFRGSQLLFVWLFCCDHKSRNLCCLWQDRWLQHDLIQE